MLLSGHRHTDTHTHTDTHSDTDTSDRLLYTTTKVVGNDESHMSQTECALLSANETFRPYEET